MNEPASPPPGVSPLLRFLFPASPAARARRDRILLVLGLVAAVFLVARAMHEDAGVLVRNREFGARFLDHEDPYVDPVRGHRVHGPYPPSYVLVTAPLALLPVDVARCAWALLQVASLAAAYGLARTWLRRGWPDLAPHAPAVFALALLLASRFVLRDMAGGGGNLVYATCALWGLQLALAGAELGGGACLALSLVLKPNLAPLALFLAARRRSRALLALVVVGGLLLALPASQYGWEPWWDLVARWVRDVLRFAQARALDDPTAIPDGFPLADTSMNQSLRETLWRWLPADAAAWITRVVSLALVVLAVRMAWRARGPREERLAAAAFLPVALLVSPISWKAHHAALLLLFCVLVAEACRARRRWLGIALTVYYGACVVASEELVGKAWKNALQEYAVVTGGALALFACAYLLARPRSRTEDV